MFQKGPLVWYPCYYILMLLSSEGTRVLPCRELCWFSSVEPIVSTSITSTSTLCCILQTWEPMHRHGSGWSNGSTTRTTGSDSRPTPSVTPGESNISVRSTGKSDSAKNRESGQTHTSDIVGEGGGGGGVRVREGHWYHVQTPVSVHGRARRSIVMILNCVWWYYVLMLFSKEDLTRDRWGDLWGLCVCLTRFSGQMRPRKVWPYRLMKDV